MKKLMLVLLLAFGAASAVGCESKKCDCSPCKCKEGKKCCEPCHK